MYVFVNMVRMSIVYSHQVRSRYMFVIMVDMSTARPVVRKLYVVNVMLASTYSLPCIKTLFL